MKRQPMSLALKNIRKDCKIRIPLLILRDIESILFAEKDYKYLNDFVIDAVAEKLRRHVKAKKAQSTRKKEKSHVEGRS